MSARPNTVPHSNALGWFAALASSPCSPWRSLVAVATGDNGGGSSTGGDGG